jgi:hypothetical protein
MDVYGQLMQELGKLFQSLYPQAAGGSHNRGRGS